MGRLSQGALQSKRDLALRRFQKGTAAARAKQAEALGSLVDVEAIRQTIGSLQYLLPVVEMTPSDSKVPAFPPPPFAPPKDLVVF